MEIPWSSRWITPDSEFDLRETSSLVRSESESGSEKDDDDNAIDDREDTRSRRDKSFLLIAIVLSSRVSSDSEGEEKGERGGIAVYQRASSWRRGSTKLFILPSRWLSTMDGFYWLTYPRGKF